MHLFDNIDRHFVVDDRVVFSTRCSPGCSGEYSDYQELCTKLDALHRTERVNNERQIYTPENYGRYLGTPR